MTEYSHRVQGTAFGQSVKSLLHYDSTDPLVVKLQFPHTVWEIGRSLLIDAVSKGHSGLDRVIIDADGNTVIINLTGDESTGVIAYVQSEVEKFLDKTNTMVPYGLEFEVIDMDLEVSKFFDNLEAA